MNESSWFLRITAGEGGFVGPPVRAALRTLEAAYATGVRLRNGHYDRNGPRVVLPIPVISVGNLTTGGTGKTPFVIDLLGRLNRMGMSPAVISRGYRSFEGQPNDEEQMIRRRVPSVVCLSGADRARAGETAVHACGADVIVLDDGFQHRQLGRTLDVVLVDATCPFGFDHLLPRGLLREPIVGLRRSHVVVITRSDQVSQEALSRLDTAISRLAGDALRLKCIHRVCGIERLDAAPLDPPWEGKRAVLIAGIGRPEAFRTTVRSLGIDVVGTHWWPDHHRYTRRDVDGLLRAGRFPAHDWLLTTEKDAVKLARLGSIDRTRIMVMRVAIDFVGDGDTMWQSYLDDTLRAF